MINVFGSMNEFTFADLWVGFVMTVIAAVSTFTGAMMSLRFRQVNQRTISVILGFAAGVMLYTAFVKLMSDAVSVLSAELPMGQVKVVSTLWFFVGILLLYPLDYLVNVWKRRKRKGREEEPVQEDRHIAILVLLTITAHSFVEGVATFLSYLSTPWIAIPLVLSIIVHNFPEGMTIGALFNKISDSVRFRRAVLYSVIASLFEPVGAVLAYFFVLKYSTPVLTGILKAFLAGLLVATALNELIPNAHLKGDRRVSVQSIIAGMFIMGMVLVAGVYF